MGDSLLFGLVLGWFIGAFLAVSIFFYIPTFFRWVVNGIRSMSYKSPDDFCTCGHRRLNHSGQCFWYRCNCKTFKKES